MRMIITLTKKLLRQNFFPILVVLNMIMILLQSNENYLAISRLFLIPMTLSITTKLFIEQSSSAEYKLFVVEEVELSSTEHNSPNIYRVELLFAKCNTSIFAQLPIVDNGNNVKLPNKTIIKANGYHFKLVTIISKYLKTFDFGENCLIIQIQVIENYKTKISIRAITNPKIGNEFIQRWFLEKESLDCEKNY